MSQKTIRKDTAHIYCSVTTKNLVRSLKRGGETYDELLRNMEAQYDPAAAHGQEEAEDGV